MLLCNLASSEFDQALIKYTACKTMGLSAKAARKLYGFEDFNRQEQKILDAAEEAFSIRKTVYELAKAKNIASFRALGISVLEDSDTTDESDTCPSDDGGGVEKQSDHKSVNECQTEKENDEISDLFQENSSEDPMSDIVSDDEQINPDEWLKITNINSEASKEMIMKQIKIFRRKTRAKAIKAQTEARLLHRKLPKRASQILLNIPV